MRHVAEKHHAELAKFLAAGDFVHDGNDIIIHGSARGSGIYRTTVNGKADAEFHNLMVAEGLLYLLQAGLANATRYASWYLALYSGAVTPTANWTAANFAATASEITSGTEGYSNATRPQWVPVNASGVLTNTAAKAEFTIVATGTININGAALLSANAKGATSGVLLSAGRYPTTKVLSNTEVFGCEYDATLTDS